MSKRTVTFSTNIEHDIGEPKSQRLDEENSLDSDDEEQNSKKKMDSSIENVLTEDDIEGQEEETIKSYGEIKITPFNLKEEMEEGHFDAEGNYIPDKDNDDIKDQWLESIDWSKVDDNDSDKVVKQTDWDDEVEQISSTEKIKIMKDVLHILQPGENALVALRRLGGGKKKGKKHSEEKNTDKKGENEEEKRKQLLKLTELVDLLLQQGDFEIYNKTFEKLSYQVKQEEEKYADPGTDDDDELEKAFAEGSTPHANKGTSKDSPTLQSEVMWEYKWEDNDKVEIYGPYSNSCMQSWSEQGFFKDGVFCRKIGSEGSFYNSKRIDFELYE